MTRPRGTRARKPTLPPPADRTRFRRVLLKWYDQHGRDLPWRTTDDPYHILVSEVMLQQTQVDRVLPKYHHPGPVSVHPHSPAAQAAGRPNNGVQPAAFVYPKPVPAGQQPIAESPIDLGIALRLAGVENPTINLARESIREAQAEQQARHAHIARRFAAHTHALAHTCSHSPSNR